MSAMSRLVAFSAFIYLCAQLPAQSISVPKTVPPDVQQHIDRVTTWPDFRPEIHTPIKLDPAVLTRFVGNYELLPHFTITVTLAAIN
jgi:hypothetical protein